MKNKDDLMIEFSDLFRKFKNSIKLVFGLFLFFVMVIYMLLSKVFNETNKKD